MDKNTSEIHPLYILAGLGLITLEIFGWFGVAIAAVGLGLTGGGSLTQVGIWTLILAALVLLPAFWIVWRNHLWPFAAVMAAFYLIARLLSEAIPELIVINGFVVSVMLAVIGVYLLGRGVGWVEPA